MRISILFFVLGSGILSITGCKKDAPVIITRGSNSVPNPRPTGPPGPNSVPGSIDSTPPKAYAGSNVLVFLPAESCKLYGGAYSLMNGIESYMWRKISGPSSYKINSPDSFWTSISNLVKGVYEFELTATDKIGLKGVDTAIVTVGEMLIPQMSISNISWGYEGANGTLLWGATLILKNINGYIPVGSDIKVFVSNKFPGAWVQAVGADSPGSANETYFLFIKGSSLYVWSSYEETGAADIMIYY